MKKYLLGSLAIVLAVGFSAFTSKDNLSRFSTTLFYQSTDFSQTEVQKPSNWTTTDNLATCNGSNKACKVVVDDTYISGGTFNTTDFTITLQAESASPAALQDVKNSGTTISPVISNRP